MKYLGKYSMSTAEVRDSEKYHIIKELVLMEQYLSKLYKTIQKS